MGRRGTPASAALVMVAVVLISGCIGIPDGGDGADEDGVTVTIDFEGYSPATRPGERAEWTPEGGSAWSVVAEPRSEGALYLVHNVTGTTVLDVLLSAADAAGFAVDHDLEAMGAFVNAIDGVENGMDDHHWSYYLNDEYGQIASDRAYVEDGDVVRWVYMGNPFG